MIQRIGIVMRCWIVSSEDTIKVLSKRKFVLIKEKSKIFYRVPPEWFNWAIVEGFLNIQTIYLVPTTLVETKSYISLLVRADSTLIFFF